MRGKPIIVVQTLTESAVAIAASYAAKAFGIKTGTLVKEARRLCPAVIPVQARASDLHRLSRAHPAGGRYLRAGRKGVLDRRGGVPANGH